MKNSNLKAVYRTAGVIAVAAIVIFSMAACDLDPPGGGGFGAPTGFSATATSSSAITLSWNAVSGATHYFVYQGTSSSGNGSYAGAVTTAGADVSGLSSSTTYYFWVTAYNSNTEEESGYSSMASATTLSPPGNGTQSSPYSLYNGSWENGSITSSAPAQWYSFSVIQGNNYYVWWNDSYQGNGSKTVDVKVTLWFNDVQHNVGGTSEWDHGWNSSTLKFNSSGTGTMKVRVEAYSPGYTGTFGICYSTNNYRPPTGSASGTQHDPIPLYDGYWENGSISSGSSSSSAVWYSFMLPAGQTYRVYWNDSYSGNNTKTADIRVTGYIDNDSSSWWTADSGWSSGYTLTNTGSNAFTVKLLVTNYYSSGSGGTFGIVYTSGTSRPAL